MKAWRISFGIGLLLTSAAWADVTTPILQDTNFNQGFIYVRSTVTCGADPTKCASQNITWPGSTGTPVWQLSSLGSLGSWTNTFGQSVTSSYSCTASPPDVCSLTANVFDGAGNLVLATQDASSGIPLDSSVKPPVNVVDAGCMVPYRCQAAYVAGYGGATNAPSAGRDRTSGGLQTTTNSGDALSYGKFVVHNNGSITQTINAFNEYYFRDVFNMQTPSILSKLGVLGFGGPQQQVLGSSPNYLFYNSSFEQSVQHSWQTDMDAGWRHGYIVQDTTMSPLSGASAVNFSLNVKVDQNKFIPCDGNAIWGVNDPTNTYNTNQSNYVDGCQRFENFQLAGTGMGFNLYSVVKGQGTVLMFSLPLFSETASYQGYDNCHYSNYLDKNNNGVFDKNDALYIDVNNNGVYDAGVDTWLAGPGFIDVNHNGVYDAGVDTVLVGTQKPVYEISQLSGTDGTDGATPSHQIRRFWNCTGFSPANYQFTLASYKLVPSLQVNGVNGIVPNISDPYAIPTNDPSTTPLVGTGSTGLSVADPFNLLSDTHYLTGSSSTQGMNGSYAGLKNGFYAAFCSPCSGGAFQNYTEYHFPGANNYSPYSTNVDPSRGTRDHSPNEQNKLVHITGNQVTYQGDLLPYLKAAIQSMHDTAVYNWLFFGCTTTTRSASGATFYLCNDSATNTTGYQDPDSISMNLADWMVDKAILSGLETESLSVDAITYSGLSLNNRVRYPRNDFNADKTSDILLRDLSTDVYTGQWKQFSFSQGAIISSNYVSAYSTLNYQYQGTLDADGDGDADILVRDTNTGQWFTHPMQNGNSTGATLLSLPTDSAWTFAVSGDFDGDGTEDIVLRNISTNTWQVYYMVGGNVNSNTSITALSNSTYGVSAYQAQAAGDMNDDGKNEILIRNTSTGAWRIYNFVGNSVSNPSNLYVNTSWQFQTLEDLNGDGKLDVVLRNTSSGYWSGFITGPNFSSSVYSMNNLYVNTSTISLSTYGDFDNDGIGDILLRETSGQYDLFRTLPPGFSPLIRAASTPYTLNQMVVQGGNVYLCTTAGTTGGATSITFNTPGVTSDGTVGWTYVGSSSVYVAGQQVMVGHPIFSTPGTATWTVLK